MTIKLRDLLQCARTLDIFTVTNLPLSFKAIPKPDLIFSLEEGDDPFVQDSAEHQRWAGACSGMCCLIEGVPC